MINFTARVSNASISNTVREAVVNSKGFILGEDDEIRLEFFLLLLLSSRRRGVVVVKGVALFCRWNNNDGAAKEEEEGDDDVMNISLLRSERFS